MPYSLLQSILGAAFFAVWAFIAATMLRDKLSEARARRLPDRHSPNLPSGPHRRSERKRRRQRSKSDEAVAGV
ncbi:hypothetical protein Pla123a_22300 [Posidoniimonas polymericola]|uniref:CcmD family protein n=1 Tax=Posidoniimonas polymericola TaxID=2528002 RepID=A0A5C5YRQ1_9BACT|nr:hypothetical protein [Posidoniimonas polymericola]TWT77569.1 hypothetical protein Pla123a_22300 [Posidoniimonas polymericola]